MPIYLKAPAYRNGGPDGRGWTRMAINSMAVGVNDECALRPHDYSHLRESHADTRRARWGGYGSCISGGHCESCPIFKAVPLTLTALTDRVLVRSGPGGSPYLMNRPEDGWASVARRWTWRDLARLNGWTVGRRHQDEHSDGFWLERAEDPS
ncbi:hypothetical protein ACIQMV_08755 [Streptomyces sp. NPDC091412]|uniref:hypothetical protein n=1 Tax=Streptomyces sp. NPDC091412 TaxID=3366002 RepID=UPI003804B2AB